MSALNPAVNAQYEAYPYPARDPADEARRLVTGSPSRLDELNHYVFDGRLRLDADAPPLRILVAGGGTGDALVMLAQQFHDSTRRAEIVYLDMSTASRAVAEARIAARGLTAGVRFVTGSLMDAADHGPFDYIDCCGVLHHLPDPAAGLAALAAALAPGGGMGLMVYAEHGRAGVYLVQQALATLAPPSLPMPERIARARRLLDALPPHHRFMQSPWLRDHVTSEAGLVDLLLHAQDRAYTVPQLVAWVEGAGLAPAAAIPPLLYDPRFHCKDAALLADALRRPRWEQAALAELLSGTMIKHIVYVRERAAPPLDPADPTLVPVLTELDGKAIGAALTQGARMEVKLEGRVLRPALPACAPRLLPLIDGARSWSQLFDLAGIPAPARPREQQMLAGALIPLGRLHLRQPAPVRTK